MGIYYPEVNFQYGGPLVTSFLEVFDGQTTLRFTNTIPHPKISDRKTKLATFSHPTGKVSVQSPCIPPPFSGVCPGFAPTGKPMIGALDGFARNLRQNFKV